MKQLAIAALCLCCCLASGLRAGAQTTADDDIWRSVELGELDYQKEKNYCLRLYGYYRYTDDGTVFYLGRQSKEFFMNEGICEMDLRYNRKSDEGVEVMVARNLVHPEQSGWVMDYYELKPYTFLEQARRTPKRFTIETAGDTTRVYTRHGLAGTAIRDTARQQLRMQYNALAPDTAKTINLILLRAHLSHVDAEAIYDLVDSAEVYVPQGQLRQVTFEGDVQLQVYPGVGVSHGETGAVHGGREFVKLEYHERSEFYVDSVVYMTRTEYKADQKTTVAQRRERCGYTTADIDRLKQKLGVPPLTSEQLQRIEAQRDWEEMEEHWEKTHALPKTVTKVGEKMEEKIEQMMQDEQMQKVAEKVQQAVEKAVDKQMQEND